jgi:hypothetical protein
MDLQLGCPLPSRGPCCSTPSSPRNDVASQRVETQACTQGSRRGTPQQLERTRWSPRSSNATATHVHTVPGARREAR